MADKFILTPLFLDQDRPALRAVAQPDWAINTPILPEGETQARMSVVHEALAEKIASILKEGARPVSVAGDCCAAIGVVAGLQRAGIAPVLVWLDAHGDFNTWETTPSRFLGGMPLAMLVGRGEQTMVQAVGLTPLAEDHVFLMDARDLDPGERVALEHSHVQHVTDWRTLVGALPDAPVYVHFDTDYVNPLDAPAQSYVAAGGPRAREVQQFFHALAHTGKLIAVSMCAWYPALDADGRTRVVSMQLLDALTG